MRVRLWILASLVVLCVIGSGGADQLALAATPSPATSIDIPLRTDKPLASLTTYLKSANGLDPVLRKRLTFFALLLMKTPLPALDNDDLHLRVADATDLKGNKLDIVPVLTDGPDHYIVAGVSGGWVKYGPIPNYAIRFVKNAQQVTFYPVYENTTKPGDFLPVIEDVAPALDAKGTISYLLPDGTLLAQYVGKFVKEMATGFLLNVSQDVGEYVEVVGARQLYHYGWRAYKMPTAKLGVRWRVLPKPGVDDIGFFQNSFRKVLLDNLKYIQQAYASVAQDVKSDFAWTADNISQRIANYHFPGAGAARPVLLDSGSVDISPAFFAQEDAKIKFAEGSIDLAVRFSKDTYQRDFTPDQVTSAILYPFQHPDALDLYDRFRLASALTVSDSGHFPPLVISIERPEDMPSDAVAETRSDGRFRMNAAFILHYVLYPGVVTGILSHELGGHYVEGYSLTVLKVSLRPLVNGTLISDSVYNTIEPFNYLRTMRDEASLLLQHRVDPADLNFELFMTGSFVPFVGGDFGDTTQ